MSCLFFFKSKKSRNVQNNNNRRGLNSAPVLMMRNQTSSSSSFNLPTPRSLPSPRSIRELYSEKEQNLRVFPYQELSDATNGFNRMLRIGQGGFGSVYKGTIRVSGRDSCLVVAIKKLNQQGLQGHKQWLAEVQFLGVVDHPNVVKLFGYCAEDGERGIERLLVYEYMPNRSLEDHLFGRKSSTLPWKQRLEIMLGAAQGLAYLHGIEVIYRDFKSSNVLLDDEFRPKLSDFGLAREGPTGDRTHVTTARVGTQGYAAPEYVETGHLRWQSDVWSFGVVLYEILAGRRTIERNRPAAEQKLLDWVQQYPADSRRFSMIMDPRLRNNYVISSAKKVAKLADSCLNRYHTERPTMTFVAESLRRIIDESDGRKSSAPAAAAAAAAAAGTSFLRSPIRGSSRGSSNGVSVRG